MMKVLSLVIILVVVCTEGYIVDLSSSQLVPETRLRERSGHAETPEVHADGESPVLSSRLAAAKSKRCATSMDTLGSTYHHPPAQDLVKTLYRRDVDLTKAKRNCERCLNGIYCKEMKKCKICTKMCRDAGIPMPEKDSSNSTSASAPMATTASTVMETTERLAAETPVELEERFGEEPVETEEPRVGEPEELRMPLVGEPEENFIKNQEKDLEPETLNDETVVTASMKDGKAFRLEPEFYTVGSFGPGPVKDLMERLLSITEDQAGRIIRLVVIAQTKTTYQDEQAVILDSVHAFDRHVPIIVSVTKGQPRQLAFEEMGKGGKPSVSRDQLESIIDQVMKEVKDTPTSLPETVAPKEANEIPDEEFEKKPAGHFNDYDIDDNGEGFPFVTSPRPVIKFGGRQGAPLSSEDQVKETEDFGNVDRMEMNDVGSPEEMVPKEGFPRIPEERIVEETIPKEAEARIPQEIQDPAVGFPEETSNARENLEKSIIDVVENSLKGLDNSRLEEANPEEMMKRMERPLEQMEQRPMERMEQRPMERMIPMENMEQMREGSVMQPAEGTVMQPVEGTVMHPVEGTEQIPMGRTEPMENIEQIREGSVMEPVEGTEQIPMGRTKPTIRTEPRPMNGMEQRLREVEEKPLKTMQANGPTTKTFAIPVGEEPQSESTQVMVSTPSPDEEFEQKVHDLVTPKIHVKELPEEFPTDQLNLQARMTDAESSEDFNKFGELVPRDGQPGNVFFVGKDIKLPLTLVKDKTGRVRLTVDMDRLCSCKNQTCTKPHLEEMIRQRRSLEPDFVNSIEHVFDNQKNEDEDELVKLTDEYQFRRLEEKLEDKLDMLNKDVEKYNEENETLLNKGTLALFKNVEKAKNVEKTIDMVNTVLSWMKNLTIHHAAS